MAEQRGVGVELQISGDKAKANIQGLIEQLVKLEKAVDKVNNTEITLTSKFDSSAFNKAQQKTQETETKATQSMGKIAQKHEQTNAQIVQSDEKAAQTRQKVISRLEQEVTAAENRMARKAEETAQKMSNIIPSAGRGLQSFGTWGGQLNRSITDFSNALLNPIRGIFSSAKSFVTNTVSESIGQIEKLELAQVGLKNHFKSDASFNIEDYIQTIRSTAEKTQGLSAGDLADYIAQLAPLSNGNSQAAYDATMGALKIIKYGGGDTTTDMMSIIKNIRDVQSKGKAYQMDLNQFNRAAPLLATMLEQQGMSQFVKKSSDGVLSLNITKDNYQGLLDAFAKLNYNEELNNAFEEMSKTLSGLVEQTKQSVQNDVMDLLNYSKENQKSLLDIWKDFLQGDDLNSVRNTLKKELQQAASALAKFLDELDKKDILDTAFKALREFGAYAKKELLPTVKRLLGISEDATATDVIKGFIQKLLEFGKGVIDGMKFFITVLDKAKNVISNIFGDNVNGIMMALGWAKGFSKVGWDLVSGLGKLVTGIGNTVNKISGFGKWLNTSLGGSGGFMSGFGGLLMAGGLGASVADFFYDDRSANDKMLVNDISAAITGVGTALSTGSPLLGLITATGQLIVKSLADKWKDVEKIKEVVAKEQEASKTDFQGKMVTSVIQQMASKENPIYFANNPISMAAEEDVRKWAVDNITTDMQPLEAQQAIRDKLKERIAYRTGHAKLAELGELYLGENSKFAGSTQITAKNANQYTAQIRKVWDYLDKYGFLQQMEGYENLPNELSGEVMWNFLYGDGASSMIAKIGSKEALDAMVQHLGEVDVAVKEIQESDTELEWEMKLDTASTSELNDEITRTMRAMGFEWVDGRGWVATLHYRTEMEATGDLNAFEDNPDNYKKGYLSSTDTPRPAKFNNGTYAAPVFKSFDNEPSEEAKQRARAAYGFTNDEYAYRDKLGQWNGASSNLDNISAQDRQNYDNDLDDVIQRSLNMYNNGEAPNDYEQALLVEALIRRYQTWGEVIKNRGNTAASYLFQMVLPWLQKSSKTQDLDDGYKAVYSMLTQPREAWEEDGRGDLGIYLDGINDAWREWLKKLYGDKVGTVGSGAYVVHRASGGIIEPMARPAKPLFFNWGGQARGVDTIPAMLSPGEFVEKSSAVKRAGLSVMNALNEGDLGRAYRLIGAKLNSATNTNYDSRRYDTHDSHNTTNNFVRIMNKSSAAANTSYRGLRNIMALR